MRFRASGNDLLERLQVDSPVSPSAGNCLAEEVPAIRDEIAMNLAVVFVDDAHKGIQSEFKMKL